MFAIQDVDDKGHPVSVGIRSLLPHCKYMEHAARATGGDGRHLSTREVRLGAFERVISSNHKNKAGGCYPGFHPPLAISNVGEARLAL